MEFLKRPVKGFLKERKAFILSGVSERSLCGELMKYFTIEISKTEFSAMLTIFRILWSTFFYLREFNKDTNAWIYNYIFIRSKSYFWILNQ